MGLEMTPSLRITYRGAEVFADAFNYLQFTGGEKVIIPESLHELDSTATTIIHDG